MRRSSKLAPILAAPLALITGCGADDSDSTDSSSAPVVADRCVLELHGRSEQGSPPTIVDGVAHLRPDGNDRAGPGRQWLYAEPADLETATAIVRDAIDTAACQAVAVHGFSNGAAFAAKLYCSGDDFGGRLRGVVIDDPVTDASATGCAPAVGVEGALYWTGSLESTGSAGTECADIGWTCEGPIVVGIDAYSAALGLAVLPSIRTDHLKYENPPELARWLAAS